MSRLLLLICFLSAGICEAQFLSPKGSNESWSYQEIISSYKALAQTYNNALYIELGPTDSGRPLSLFLIQKEAFADNVDLQTLKHGKLVTLVNNGIHPGESCGMDASLQWSVHVLEHNEIKAGQLIAVIPVYNIGGSLQARPNTRANQNGPEKQGFRGNARNLDLNRDFIKADAANTFSFQAVFQALRPHIFIDTHTSNGADYPYTMTYISTQLDKLAPPLAELLDTEMDPFLYKGMAERGWETVPYVNVHGRPPNGGYAAFLETPRYASGYTALFHSLGFISEAHMFKSYPDRVAATYAFLETVKEFSEQKDVQILQAYALAEKWEVNSGSFPVAWELDSSKREDLNFKAYSFSYSKSNLGDYKRLSFDRSQTEDLVIDYYPRYKATQMAEMPKYFVIPRAWAELVLRLQYNNVELQVIPKDTVIAVYSYYLKNWEHAQQPYEGHFRTTIKEVEQKAQNRLFYKGDYLVSANQKNRYFLATTLHPLSVDSYLSWGFFDIIFQQKEHFSPYIFEDQAEAMLAADTKLQEAFTLWKQGHPKSLNNPYAVLSFFYENSDYYESEHLRYPIAEIR
jgi:hypothetical protein